MAFGAETITLKQNKVVKTFKEHNAISPDTAKDLNSLNIYHTRTFNHLVKQAVIRKSDDKYYLDMQNWEIFRKSFKRWFLI
ncbi:hypothetical protein [Staphylococcus sp. 11261D007BR]